MGSDSAAVPAPRRIVVTVNGAPAPALESAVEQLLSGRLRDPHDLLGPHESGHTVRIRAFHPEATTASVARPDGVTPMRRLNAAGFFEVTVPAGEPGYRIRFRNDEREWEQEDPYRFAPTLGELDLHLIGEGTHTQLWRALGARVIEHQGVTGTGFSVWAPNALGVSVVSDANFWDARTWPMRALGGSGVWELFCPGVGPGVRYKFLVTRGDGMRIFKADPLARSSDHPPGTASIVEQSAYRWRDGTWMRRRAKTPMSAAPFAAYEVHLGSWRRHPDGRVMSYREIAEPLAAHCRSLGFTHVELLPVMEHPFGGSWGYQVTGYYAPTSRHGTPDDFRKFIDVMHRNGIGVILDWVPAHFPRDGWALARFDGTPLYEHGDPRRGEHPDWGTYVFNYGRNQVRNFLVANAHYWAEEFHIDGLRVDAVASMLYLDYSRQPDAWVPNINGGKENLEAITLLREVNDSLHARKTGVITIAEESTTWPGVTRSTASGGLGFDFKWNMGWMHDTLDYLHKDPVFRRYAHHLMTFGLMYAWSERYILPLSHDEVVHLKGSLLGKMSGDPWKRFANLRVMFGWMWAHPGKKLLFMGGELGDEREWNHESELDWASLNDPSHAGIQQFVADLGALYAATPALWELDESPNGFEWIDAGNAEQNVLSFVRRDAHGHPGIACIANFAPVVRYDFRVGLPLAGRWTEVLNSDSDHYGGSGIGNMGEVVAEAEPWHTFPYSARMTIPPLAVVWLAPATT
jgi:1,4-alpha-glucan branching enzyme